MSDYHWVGISVALIVLVLWGLNRFVDSKNQPYDPTAHMPRARRLEEDLPTAPAHGDRFTNPIYSLGLAAMRGPVGDPGPPPALLASLKIPVSGDTRADSTGMVWFFDGLKWLKVVPTVRTPEELEVMKIAHQRMVKLVLG